MTRYSQNARLFVEMHCSVRGHDIPDVFDQVSDIGTHRAFARNNALRHLLLLLLRLLGARLLLRHELATAVPLLSSFLCKAW